MRLAKEGQRKVGEEGRERRKGKEREGGRGREK